VRLRSAECRVYAKLLDLNLDNARFAVSMKVDEISGCFGRGIYCLLPFKSDKSFSSGSARLRGAFPEDVR
jgi:hypothetical protein